MIAGATLAFWLWFHAAVLLILLVDFFWFQHKPNASITPSVIWTLLLVLLSLSFAAFLYFDLGRQASLEFVSGYAIELSLSVDNLFVFLLLFDNFGLGTADQRKALTWGVAGAIVMRGLFIVAGVALLERFMAVEYIFGAILLIAAIRLLLQKEGRHKQPAWIKWLTGGNPSGRSKFLLAVIAIEVTDLVFALDSVPAVIAVSHETFIIYTSNICAILGLRSLYFVLAGMLHKLRLLHYGLGLILAFVGIKMLLAHWLNIPIGVSLGIILGTVAIFTIASLLMTKPEPAANSATTLR
jgi:tellurite resistance protein TerC